MTFYQRGQYSEAGKVVQEALKMAEKTFHANHPDLASVCENLADCLRKLGKTNEAEELEARARKIRSSQ